MRACSAFPSLLAILGGAVDAGEYVNSSGRISVNDIADFIAVTGNAGDAVCRSRRGPSARRIS